MPRVLTMHRKIVPPQDRKGYLDRLRAKRDYYKRANCTFSAFEEEGLPGAFLEFFEAPDSPTLTAAHAAAPEPIVDPRRIYKLVEL
jgi:hypothetical protein